MINEYLAVNVTNSFCLFDDWYWKASAMISQAQLLIHLLQYGSTLVHVVDFSPKRASKIK